MTLLLLLVEGMKNHLTKWGHAIRICHSWYGWIGLG
jgi:hypothetical protein